MNIERKSSTVDAKRAEERLDLAIVLIGAPGLAIYLVYGNFISLTYLILVASASAALAIASTAAVRTSTWRSYLYFVIVMIGPSLALSFGLPELPGAGVGTIGGVYFLGFALGGVIGRELFPARSAS